VSLRKKANAVLWANLRVLIRLFIDKMGNFRQPVNKSEVMLSIPCHYLLAGMDGFNSDISAPWAFAFSYAVCIFTI